MKLLNAHQIQQKIKRLAIQMLENNFGAKELILAGINERGYRFAELIYDQLGTLTDIPIHLTHIRLSPQDPLRSGTEIDLTAEELNGKTIIVIDDVAMSGRTIFYACKPLLETQAEKVEVCVLVDRKHKAFPVKVDYLGLSLATTLYEMIEVKILPGDEMGAFLVEHLEKDQ